MRFIHTDLGCRTSPAVALADDQLQTWQTSFWPSVCTFTQRLLVVTQDLLGLLRRWMFLLDQWLFSFVFGCFLGSASFFLIVAAFVCLRLPRPSWPLCWLAELFMWGNVAYIPVWSNSQCWIIHIYPSHGSGSQARLKMSCLCLMMY